MFSHWLLMARHHSDMTVSYPAQLSNNTRHMLKPWATLHRLQTNFSLSPEFYISDIQQMLKYLCRLTLKRLDILLQMLAEEKNHTFRVGLSLWDNSSWSDLKNKKELKCIIQDLKDTEKFGNQSLTCNLWNRSDI